MVEQQIYSALEAALGKNLHIHIIIINQKQLEKIHNLLFRIWKVLYACKENVNMMDLYQDQVDIVRQKCGKQEACNIEANSHVFGKRVECAGISI